MVEPSEKHYYQPGWTMVGAGVFDKEDTERTMDSVWPAGINRIKDEVVSFDPDNSSVTLKSGKELSYKVLIVAPGLKLDWGAIEGLEESLGANGVTSNYRYDLAPYTWELVKSMSGKNAIFTQPPMPIKCAGAPQKAMYLSCDEWMKKNILKDIKNRIACLIGNHGQIAFSENLSKAFELAEEVENLSHQYITALKIGRPKILSIKEMKKVLGKAKNYKRQ